MVEHAAKLAMKELSGRFEQFVAEEVRKRLEARDAADVLAVEQARARSPEPRTSGRLRPPLPERPITCESLVGAASGQPISRKTAEAFIIMRRKKYIPLRRRTDRP